MVKTTVIPKTALLNFSTSEHPTFAFLRIKIRGNIQRIYYNFIYRKLKMLVEVFVSLVLLWVIRYAVTTYVTRKTMPPGPFPYPLIGNIPQLLCDPIHPFSKLAEKYGDIYTVTIPSGNAVVLNTATLIREARLKKQQDILGRIPEYIYPWTEIFGKDVMTEDYSPAWVFRRRVFKSAMHVLGAGVEQASGRVGHAVNLTMKEIDENVGQPFSPKNLFEWSILVEIWEWLTSKKVQLNDPIVKSLSQFNEIMSKQALLSSMYQLIPFLTYLPTRFNKDIEQALQIKSDLFLKEYRAHLKTYTPGVIRDLTDSFISAYETEKDKEKTKNSSSPDDIPNLMLNVTFGGSDSSSTSLSWFILYMVQHPNIQEKIYHEINSVVGNERLPNWKDAKDLSYLQATLCEVQRASGMVTHAAANANNSTSLAGYHIPKETLVIFNYFQVHHDEREWEDPEIFKPERFLDSGGEFVGWNKLHAFIPFGIGRRDCPGQSLAKITVFTYASTLLYRYKFQPPLGGKYPSTKVSTPAIVLRPDDFMVVAEKRNGFTY